MCGAAGTWSKLEVADALAGVEWLQLEGGEVGIQLRASLSSTDGVHNVEVRACFCMHKSLLCNHLLTLPRLCKRVFSSALW